MASTDDCSSILTVIKAVQGTDELCIMKPLEISIGAIERCNNLSSKKESSDYLSSEQNAEDHEFNSS